MGWWTDCACTPPPPVCSNCDGDTIDLEMVVSGVTLASGCADDDSGEFNGTWALSLRRNVGCCYWIAYITGGSQNLKPARKSNTAGALHGLDTKSASCTVAEPIGVGENGNSWGPGMYTPVWVLQIGNECFLPSPTDAPAMTSATVRLSLLQLGRHLALYNGDYIIEWWTIWDGLATGTPDVPCDLSLDLPLTLTKVYSKERVMRYIPASGYILTSTTDDYNWPTNITLQAA